GLSATVLPDGRVMATSGFATNVVELYSPASNSWTSGAVIPNSGSCNMRQYFPQVLLPDGKVIVIAGDSGGCAPLQFTTTEIYDPALDAWSSGPSLATARWEHAAVLLPDGKIFVA